MQESLFRVKFTSNNQAYTMYLKVWGFDAFDVMQKIKGIIGPGTEYMLIGIAFITNNDGSPIKREAIS